MFWRVVALMGLLSVCMVNVGNAAQVHFSWDFTQGTKPAIGFHFYRAATCTGPFVRLNTDLLPLTPLAYTDTDATPGESYCWLVTSLAADGEEAAGPTGHLFSTVPILSSPTNLRITGMER